jgi:parvulin-like peptidyl-prolyl isomerase
MKTAMKLSKTSIYLSLALATSLSIAQQQPAKPPAAPVLNKPDNDAKPAAPPVTVPPEAVVVTVGSEKLTRAQFEQILAALADNGRAAATPAAKRQVADQLGEVMALAQEARKRKLDQSPVVQQMLVIQTDQLLANALGKQISSELKIDDAALKAYYEQHKSEYELAKASHILIRFKGSRVPLKPDQKDLTEEEALAKAQDIHKRLLAGGDFAAIAKAESDDSGAAANGGSLGAAFPRGKMVPQFDQVVFSLPVGQLSEPAKTPFGYHIIKVEERNTKTFEEARPDLEKKMRPEMTREAMDKMRKQTPVSLDDSYFGK